MERFEQLASTSAEHEALQALRNATGECEGPMERHCLRCRHIAARLASQRGWIVDGEVLTVASILHDIGLYRPVATDDVYTADGAALGREIAGRHGFNEQRTQLLADAIDRHHDVRSQVARGAEVEALRRADLIELTSGLIRYGLPRAWIQELRTEIRPDGIYPEIARELGRALRERPSTLPRIFLRPQ